MGFPSMSGPLASVLVWLIIGSEAPSTRAALSMTAHIADSDASLAGAGSPAALPVSHSTF